jgi:hypothetical protein
MRSQNYILQECHAINHYVGHSQAQATLPTVMHIPALVHGGFKCCSTNNWWQSGGQQKT